jgi:hypothetical protein
MRGFVITILSLCLMVMLVVLAMSLRNAQLGTERALLEPLPLTYAAFLLDDVGYEFNSLLGPVITLRETNDSTTVSVSDSIDGYNHTAELSSYEAFIEGPVAAGASNSIDMNLTNLTDGVITVFINGEYRYANDHGDNESLFTRDGGTNASAYEINLTAAAIRSNVTGMAFNESGTLNVTIRYTDLNGTETESGAVFPDNDNSFQVNYADGSSVLIMVGRHAGNDGSLLVRSSGISALSSWSAALPPIGPDTRMGYEYDATISYVQGNAAKHCRIGK